MIQVSVMRVIFVFVGLRPFLSLTIALILLFTVVLGKRNFVLAVSFSNGFVYLLKSYDDVSPIHLNTEMNGSIGFVMEWSNAQELLAVAGTIQQKLPAHDAHDGNAICYENVVKFYTECGYHLYTARIPSTHSQVSAMTWGHSDKRLFIATGNQVHIAWVSRKVAALQLLCRLQVQACIGSDSMVPKLPLPARIKSLISNMYSQTIRVSKDKHFFLHFVSCLHLFQNIF